MRTALLLFLSLFWPLVQAGGLEQMNQFLKNLDRLAADFQQVIINQQTQEVARSNGVFYLERPNHLRWDYNEPEQQQIVADGRQVWVYDPELEQVSVQSQESALKGTPAMLLVTGVPVESQYKVTELNDRGSQGWVELIPLEEEGQFSRILLGFEANQIAEMQLIDNFGQISQFHFSNVEHPSAFTSRFFVFEPPLHIDIYNR